MSRRSAGEALDPAREPLETLNRIRETIGEMNFAAQYQQRPGPAGGGMINNGAWLRRYAPEGIVRKPFDRYHPELGHRQQAERAFRLFRLHHLGPQRP